MSVVEKTLDFTKEPLTIGRLKQIIKDEKPEAIMLMNMVPRGEILSPSFKKSLINNQTWSQWKSHFKEWKDENVLTIDGWTVKALDVLKGLNEKPLIL